MARTRRWLSPPSWSTTGPVTTPPAGTGRRITAGRRAGICVRRSRRWPGRQQRRRCSPPGSSPRPGGSPSPWSGVSCSWWAAGSIPGRKVCDLIQMSVTGPIGGSGDTITPTSFQLSGGSLAYTSSPAALFPFTATLPVPSNPSWPVPPSFITPAFLNTNIRDTILFLVNPPCCKAYYTAGSTTIPNQAFPAGTAVPLNTVAFYNYAAFTTGSGGGYTAPVAGVYFLYGQVNYAPYGSGGAVAYSAGLSVNGGTIQWGDSVYRTTAEGNGGGAIVRKRLRLSAGDFVQLCAQQSTTGSLALNATAANQTRFIALWESA